MRQIVKDVIDCVLVGKCSLSLRVQPSEFGEREIRRFCISLSAWWSRPDRTQRLRPNLSMSPAYPWHPRFRAFVETVPELRELLDFDDIACRFSAAVTLDEQHAIIGYAREHYRPLMLATPLTFRGRTRGWFAAVRRFLLRGR